MTRDHNECPGGLCSAWKHTAECDLKHWQREALPYLFEALNRAAAPLPTVKLAKDVLGDTTAAAARFLAADRVCVSLDADATSRNLWPDPAQEAFDDWRATQSKSL